MRLSGNMAVRGGDLQLAVLQRTDGRSHTRVDVFHPPVRRIYPGAVGDVEVFCQELGPTTSGTVYIVTNITVALSFFGGVDPRAS